MSEIPAGQSRNPERIRRSYRFIDVRTGRKANAVWEGSPDPKNPRRLLAPRLVEVKSV